MDLRVSIGIMTQRSKKDYLEVLFYSLIQQCLPKSQKTELIIYSEEGFSVAHPQELEEKFIIKNFHYQKPFNIGRVRNSIIKTATGDYVAFLDDDVVVGPNYLETLTSVITKQKPAVLAGLTYQVFKKPFELLNFLQTMNWEGLVCATGRRDSYSRRVGRYRSEVLKHDKLGQSNWLGAIGRNMTVCRTLALQFPFFDFEMMGFEDVEFAYRMQCQGKEVLLRNQCELACLHLFHAYSSTRYEEYQHTFNTLVEQSRLPAESKNCFFTPICIT